MSTLQHEGDVQREENVYIKQMSASHEDTVKDEDVTGSLMTNIRLRQFSEYSSGCWKWKQSGRWINGSVY